MADDAASTAAASTAAVPPLPRRRRHLFWWLTLILVALAIAGFFWWRSRSAKPRYVTAGVSQGNVLRSVSMTGALNPVVTVQVGSYVSGTIKSLGCDFNTEVYVGKICATIDPVPFQLIVDQDRAEVNTAKAQLKKDQAALGYSKIAYERDSKLLTEGTVSQDAVDSDKSTYEQGQAQVNLDQASIVDKEAALKAAEVNLGYTNIVSPVVGTVITRSIDVGQTVAASLQTPTLFLIGKDLTKMQVDTNVSESDVGLLRTGQRAFFSVQSLPGRTFYGKVAQIRHGPITVQNVVTYDVVVIFDNPSRVLFPGMTADTHIVIDEHDNVLRVPLPAVRFTPEGLGHGRRGAGAGAELVESGNLSNGPAGGTPEPPESPPGGAWGSGPGAPVYSAVLAENNGPPPTDVPVTAYGSAPYSAGGNGGGGGAGGQRRHRPAGEGGTAGSGYPGGQDAGATGGAAGAAGGDRPWRRRRDGQGGEAPSNGSVTAGSGAAGQGGANGGGAGGQGAANGGGTTGQGGAEGGENGHRRRFGQGGTRQGGGGTGGQGRQGQGPGGGRHRQPGAPRQARVWVLQADGSLKPVTVTLGIDDGTLIEVSSPDLHPGDKVVVNEINQEERRRAGQGGGTGGLGQNRGGGFGGPPAGGGPRL